jgi:hypothetical protein
MAVVAVSINPTTARLQICPNGQATDSYSTAEVTFLAEGAANVLFRIKVEDISVRHTFPKSDAGWLIRVRKGSASSTDGSLSTLQKNAPPTFVDFSVATDFLSRDVTRAFGTDHILPWKVIDIAAGTNHVFNEILLQMERSGGREEKRKGWLCLEHETRAFLIADMNPGPQDDAFLFEFKPKWLAQSPNAPPGATRCRTCAHNIKNNKPIARRFCPLALVSGREPLVRNCINQLLPSLPISTTHWDVENVQEELAQFFYKSTGKILLDQLKQFQVANDPSGVLHLSPEMPQYLPTINLNGQSSPKEHQTTPSNHSGIQPLAKAMTFRDCSILIKIRMEPRSNGKKLIFDARVADFDIKVMNQRKLQKWISDELSMMDYYLSQETAQNIHPEICYLSN